VENAVELEARGTNVKRVLDPILGVLPRRGTKSLRHALDRISGILGELHHELEPLHGVVARPHVDPDQSSFSATFDANVDRPTFELRRIPRWMNRGYYACALRVDCSAPRGRATLLFDYGGPHPYSAEFSAPFDSGQISRRVLWLDRRPERVRFVAMDSRGPFTVESLRVHPIPEGLAAVRMMRRLHFAHMAFRGLRHAHILEKLDADAIEKQTDAIEILRDVYTATFAKV
jgi:hypothetical protein